ncbi:MAG: BCCT family transporter [Paracoccus sp. (in: a-proteobacteria)]|uniref:BCCT family transporter n=1 Tax=Paracoccus sp. TaxID=267 RepID=UPI0026DF8EAA|nr:BCCT family transporter [Paracoccus sp. (in: a-proteobacteria)]MDO5620650.1 BCCT family transporter [Paracoccus sp. (in: a-proteobacteria)]
MTDPNHNSGLADDVSPEAPVEETSNGVEPLPEPEGPTEVIETDYEIGQHNITTAITLEFDIHKIVFLVSAAVVVAFTIGTLMLQIVTAQPPIDGVAQPSGIELAFGGIRNFLTSELDWFFMISANLFVILCLGLILSPLGSVRLGGPEASPDFSLFGWFSMLFAAGMGIGLMFYGVAEPLGHFQAAYDGPVIVDGLRTDWAPLNGAEGDALAARRLGMAATIYHWGLHPWAIYAVVALSLALFAYNKGLPLSMRSVFYPILGERIWGWPGHVVDILAITATIFGLATSLGFGAEQATAGLNLLFGVPVTDTTRILLIIVISLIAMASVVLGVEKGVKVLSEANMILALLLLLFVVLLGPTWQIVTGFFGNLASYAREIVPLSNPFGRSDDNYRQGWTAFYWAWWISWSPFVGMFIARVSRGRTVRQFLIAVLLVPALVSVLWMTSFGGTAITQYLSGLRDAADAALELKLFAMLSHLPLAQITSLIGIILVAVFFITSSDSGSLVIDTISAGGKIENPVPQRIFWCSFQGLLAISLMLGGGLTALQAMAVSAGLPFTIVLLVACIGLVQGLCGERREVKLAEE